VWSANIDRALEASTSLLGCAEADSNG